MFQAWSPVLKRLNGLLQQRMQRRLGFLGHLFNADHVPLVASKSRPQFR